jgi:hypothetical protein
MIRYNAPKNYDSFQEFEREEIRPLFRIGFSLDDLENEANFRERDYSADDELQELEFE